MSEQAAIPDDLKDDYAAALDGWKRRGGRIPVNDEVRLIERIAALTERAEKAERERDEAKVNEDSAWESAVAHEKKYEDCPHKHGFGSCACSYDRISDVCAIHSPALKAAQAQIATQAARIAELEKALREINKQLPLFFPHYHSIYFQIDAALNPPEEQTDAKP